MQLLNQPKITQYIKEESYACIHGQTKLIYCANISELQQFADKSDGDTRPVCCPPTGHAQKRGESQQY